MPSDTKISSANKHSDHLTRSNETSLLKRMGALSALTLVGFTYLLGACDNEAPPPAEELYDTGRAAFLQSIRSRVLSPLTVTFSDRASELEEAVVARDQARSQDAWREALKVWQQLELLQIGPAGAVDARVGGADLRDHIYSFPLMSPCRVEQEWLNQRFSQAAWSEQAPYQVKGLDALEILLFKADEMSSCPEQAQIVRDGEWMSFTEQTEEYEAARWSYAEVLVRDLSTRAQALASAWGGDFGLAFEQAASPFRAQRDAVDQAFAAIFYLDQVVKDLKLGAPTGIYMSCLEEICPEQLEHPTAQLGRAALIANFEGVLMMLRGDLELSQQLSPSQEEASPSGEPVPQRAFGFRALLAQEGAPELGEELERLTLSAIEQLSASDQPLSEQLMTQPERLREIHATTRALTELLKTQVVTTLNLSVPREGAGDND